MRLSKHNFVIAYRCRGGLKLHQYPSLLYAWPVSPDVVIIQLGENDLADRDNRYIVARLCTLVDFLLCGTGCKLVMICQLLKRSPNVVGGRFNNRIIELNRTLERRFANRHDVILWKHRGL
ncbi:uncharacterized protein [Antedon mediterranea]|uniref:uncharacterized protein n=1 Tax=Antedon mediterranea TaxID=105859 RepID=UPI003AF465DB